MDRVGNLFWKRFAILVLVSLIAGITMSNYFNWLTGLITYVGIHWITIPLLIRMSMND